MGLFRVFFDIGWSSVVVRAENRAEAIEKVWSALGELRHGAVDGLRLGSYMVSAEHTLNLEDTNPQETSMQGFVPPPQAYAEGSFSF